MPNNIDLRRPTRRTFLQSGALTALGLGLPELMQVRASQPTDTSSRRGKSCILLFATGGPSQQETFDPKPDAPDNMNGEFVPISTSVPGVQISEHLPKLAKCADKFAIIRSIADSDCR